jgi:hypothetical protein
LKLERPKEITKRNSLFLNPGWNATEVPNFLKISFLKHYPFPKFRERCLGDAGIDEGLGIS